MCSIPQWPKQDRPREKLFKYGERSLSDSELLAILLRTGSRGVSALDLARNILNKFGAFSAMSHMDDSHWKGFKGLGHAKIAQLKAALEIGRRFRENEFLFDKQKIKSPKDAVDLVMPYMKDLKIEVFKMIYLDNQHGVIDIVDIATGTVDQVFPIIREIIHMSLQKFAKSIICVHNHPSGDVRPSNEDKKFTEELSQACKLMRINMLDHIIIGGHDYYSFLDK